MIKRARTPFPTVGGSFLLVIFTVLCLTVFAVLALSTAQAGSRLGDVSAQAAAEYYAADCQAEEILAQLRGGNVPQQVEENNGVYRYACPISDTQILCVEVRVDGTSYTVLRWQAVPLSHWEADDSIRVWDGGDAQKMD